MKLYRCQLWCCCFFSMVMIPAMANAAIYVLTFGDSITHATVTANGETTIGYQPVLEDLLINNGYDANVANYGSSGENTTYGLSRLQRVLEGNTYFDYVLILEGVNDLESGISEATTIYNLQQMVTTVRNYGMIPVLSNLLPDTIDLGDLVPTTYNPDIATVSSSNSVLYADNYAALVDNWSSYTLDGRHPNQAGYNIMATIWYSAMGGGSASDYSSSSSGSSSSGSSSSSDGGGGCFIATAAFGSQLESNVVMLQQFRDAFLLTNTPGKHFVRLYYRHSPPIADFIREHDWLRGVVKVLLYPLIGFSFLMLHGIISWTSVLLCLSFCFLASMFWFLWNRKRGYSPSSSI